MNRKVIILFVIISFIFTALFFYKKGYKLFVKKCNHTPDNAIWNYYLYGYFYHPNEDCKKVSDFNKLNEFYQKFYLMKTNYPVQLSKDAFNDPHIQKLKYKYNFYYFFPIRDWPWYNVFDKGVYDYISSIHEHFSNVSTEDFLKMIYDSIGKIEDKRKYIFTLNKEQIEDYIKIHHNIPSLNSDCKTSLVVYFYYFVYRKDNLFPTLFLEDTRSGAIDVSDRFKGFPNHMFVLLCNKTNVCWFDTMNSKNPYKCVSIRKVPNKYKDLLFYCVVE
jgi:hypothetical protein